MVTDEATFLELETAWNDTVERAGMAHPFLRHEWLRTWWECFGKGRRLHIIIVKFEGRIVAIAPFVWETDRMYGVPVRRLRLWQNDHTPRADVIIAERPEPSYRAIWSALLNERWRWDVLLLGQLPRESATREVFPALAADNGFAHGVWESDKSPYLELKQGWDAYFGGLTPKLRQNLRNRLTRLTKIGAPVLEVLRDREAIEGACDEALRLEASGWKREAGTSICSDPAVHRFYTLLASRAAQSGWLRLMFLTVNGRRIATAYAACHQNQLFLFKTGYDPDYEKCSPFKLLAYFALREAFATGLAGIDFLGDAESWKLEWTPTIRPHDWLFIFSGTGRARLLYPIKFGVVPVLKRWRA